MIAQRVLAQDPFRSIRPIAALVAVVAAAGVTFLNLARIGTWLRPDLITEISVLVVLFIALLLLGLAMQRLAARAASNPKNDSFFEPLIEQEDNREEELLYMRKSLGLVPGNAVLVAVPLAIMGALYTGILVTPLVEGLALWLDSPGPRLLDGPDGFVRTIVSIVIPAGLVIFPLLLVRPRRTPLGLSTRLFAALALTGSLLPIDTFFRAEPHHIVLMLFTLVLLALLIRALDALWVNRLQNMTMAEVPVPDVTQLRWARGPQFDYGSEGRTSVGIALSGGGYRASLFALGALLYVHDALGDKRRRVVAISSVSGGSVTNALLAQGGGFEQNEKSAFDALARVLIDHATGPGSMFAGLRARSYYIMLLPGTVLGGVALLAYALTQVSLSAWGYGASLVLIFICAYYVYSQVAAFLMLALMRATEDIDFSDPVSPKLPLRAKLLSMFSNLSGLGFTGLCLAPLLYLEWRQGLAVIAGVGCTFGIAAFVWSFRGPLIEQTIANLLRRAGTTEKLADLMGKTTTHHILCATEAQLGETVYFAPDAIRLRGHEPYAPNLATARAVRASAAFPLAFPPVFLFGIPRLGTTRKDILSFLVLVDGGVRDNLGFGWFEDHPDSLDEYIVISASANRSEQRPLPIVPGLSELIALLRIAFLPYNTRERLKRNLVASDLYPPQRERLNAPTGAILHIEDSPFVLPILLRYWDSPRDNAASDDPSSQPTKPPQTPDYSGYNREIWYDEQFLDYRHDQIAVAYKLRESAGDGLLKRAEAAIKHLESVEHRCLRQDPTGRPTPSSLDSGSDSAFVEWERRTRENAELKTTFAAFDRANAANLIIHGYYLACTNLHVTMDWPLLDGLSAKRLRTLFGKDAA